MYDYAIKDGDVVAGGLERPGGEDVAGASSIWDRIVAAETADQFWELVRALAPRVLLTNFNSLRGYVEWHYRPVVAQYVTPPGIVFDISGVESLGQFVRESLSGSGGKWRCASDFTSLAIFLHIGCVPHSFPVAHAPSQRGGPYPSLTC